MDIIAFLPAGRIVRATCHSVDTKDGWMILKDEKGSIIKAISAHNVTHIDFSTPVPFQEPTKAQLVAERAIMAEEKPTPRKASRKNI